MEEENMYDDPLSLRDLTDNIRREAANTAKTRGLSYAEKCFQKLRGLLGSCS